MAETLKAFLYQAWISFHLHLTVATHLPFIPYSPTCMPFLHWAPGAGSKQVGSVSEKGSLQGQNLLVKVMLLGLSLCLPEHAPPGGRAKGS